MPLYIELAQTAVFGLAIGGVIAVGAVGLTLSYGVTRFINFAYGECLTLGAFLTVLAVGLGAPLPVAAAVGVAGAGGCAVALARLFYDPILDRGLLALLVTSIGLAFVIQNLVRMIAGSNPLRFPVPLIRPLVLGDVFVPVEQLAIIVIAAVTMLAVHLVLRRTRLGRMMRAVADDVDLARAAGVPALAVMRATWFIAGAIGGLAGVLLAVTQVTIDPGIGFHFLLVVFAAVLLGGIGSPYGAMVGGLVLGLGMEFGAAYVSADYTYGVAFAVLIGVLLVNPRGLFGGRA